MERHYCFSCRDWHGFLDAAEWAQVEPLFREAQRAAARAGRIARRLRKPISEAQWHEIDLRALRNESLRVAGMAAVPMFVKILTFLSAQTWWPRWNLTLP